MQYEYTKPEQEWRRKIFETINTQGPIGIAALTKAVDIPLGDYQKRRFVEVNANLMTVKCTVRREGKGTSKSPFQYKPVSHC